MQATNLGATGVYVEQIYNGDRHELKELAFYQPLAARWDMPEVKVKHLIEQMDEEMKQYNVAMLRKLWEEERNG